MKTQAQLITDARDLLDESTARQWTEAQLRRWINEGAIDIAKRTECLQDTVNTTAVAGTQQYSLTTKWVRLHRVEFRATGRTDVIPMEYRDFDTMDDVWWTGQEQNSGDPEFWTTWGFPPQLNLVVYPKPSTAGTFKVFGYRLPTVRATDSTADAAATIECPEGWETLITEYVVMMAKRKDADPSWVEARDIYEDRLKEMNELSIRWSDQAGLVSTGGGYGVPRWLWDEGFG